MSAATDSHRLSTDGGHDSPSRRVPPIATGDLDSLALLRFETLDALAVTAAVLEEIRALQSWLRALPGRYEAASFPVRGLDVGIDAVGTTRLSTQQVERLLRALSDLQRQLDTGSSQRPETETRRR